VEDRKKLFYQKLKEQEEAQNMAGVKSQRSRMGLNHQDSKERKKKQHRPEGQFIIDFNQS